MANNNDLQTMFSVLETFDKPYNFTNEKGEKVCGATRKIAILRTDGGIKTDVLTLKVSKDAPANIPVGMHGSAILYDGFGRFVRFS